MNTQPVSTPTFPGAPRRFGTNPFVFVLGGVVLLAGLVAFGLYTRDSGETAVPVAPALEAPAPAPYFTDSVDRRGWTFYVVGSEEDAVTLRANLADAEAIRYAVGEPALLESVYVARSDDDAAAFVAAISEGNVMNYVLGLGEDQVRDLRGN